MFIDYSMESMYISNEFSSIYERAWGLRRELKCVWLWLPLLLIFSEFLALWSSDERAKILYK